MSEGEIPKMGKRRRTSFGHGDCFRIVCLSICCSALLAALSVAAFAETWDEVIHSNATYAAMGPRAWSAGQPMETIRKGDTMESVNKGARENAMGIYFPGGFEVALEQASIREASLGRKIGIVSLYEAWGNERRPDVAGVERCLQQGFVPMVTWEPWRLPGQDNRHPENQEEYSLSAISSGRHDAYIRQWALDLKGLSSRIFLRPMHEMNGNWYPWCGKVNGNRPEDYIAAWRHIRSIFNEVGCDKVMWVWSPYSESVPNDAANSFARYFPGEDEVDCMALDGYNWGSTREWSRWQTFEEVFANGYDRLTGLAPGKPLMIAEAGCVEKGGSKARWIKNAASTLKSRFTAVSAVVWFDINKECDWRIESSEESLVAFKTHFGAW
jgi:hypothetical protein